MKLKIILFLAAFLFGINLIFSQQLIPDSLNYNEFNREAMYLSYTGDYDSTISLLNYAIDYYPEKEHEIIANLVILYLIQGNEEEALRNYNYAISQNMFLGFDSEKINLDSLRLKDEFVPLLEADARLAREKENSSQTEYLVDTPEAFHPDSIYPLFIVLHDWGQNASEIREQWQAPMLKNLFITAYIQSPKVADMDGYQWDETNIGVQNIMNVYNELKEKYTIDTNQTVIGGFGQGGTLAIHILLEQLISSVGFIVVNPSMPESFTNKNLQRAKSKKQRAVMVSGVLDPAFQYQAEMINAFRKNAVLYRFSPKRRMGHEIPENMDYYIRRGLKYMGFSE